MLEIIFYVWLTMCAVYCTINYKDFAKTWWRWATIIPKKIGGLIKKWIGRK